MEEKQLKQQRINFFMTSLVAFASIFIALGIIVFHLVESSMYQNVDQNLKSFAKNTEFIREQISRQTNIPPLPEITFPDDQDPQFSEGNSGDEKLFKKGGGPNSIQQQIVLWSANGEMVNTDDLGAKQSDLSDLQLDVENLNQVESLAMKDSTGSHLHFHSITFTVTGSQDIAYIQVLTNTDQILGAVQNFRQILVFCMGIFALLSVLLSYLLSRKFSQPILDSWRKQQQFVENASHELRTPLTIIQAKLESLFTKPQHTIVEESENIALALNEVRRLNKLTTDLLFLARSDGNSLQLKKEAVLTDELVKKIVSPYQEVAASEGKSMTLSLMDNQEVLVDNEKIHQLLVILLDNALKFTRSGNNIHIQSTVKNNEWRLSIADTGQGIDDQHKKMIFDRFYREDSSRNRQTGGNGIGLSIAQWIVAIHKGKISVRDNQPQGTVFEVTLPIK